MANDIQTLAAKAERVINEVSDQTSLISQIQTALGGEDSDAVTGTPLEANTTRLQTVLELANNAGGGMAEVDIKEVNFFDYDGTCIYAYSLSELQALSELPALPSHDGLICQGWNWTLADLKAENRRMNVGAVYTTYDGKTRLYLDVPIPYTIDLNYLQTVKGGVTIDWGDGSTTTTVSDNTYCNLTHSYNNSGHYVISMTVAANCTLTLGHDSASYPLCSINTDGQNKKGFFIRKIHIGDRTIISKYAFNAAYGLRYITIPNSVTSLAEYSFYSASSLKWLTVPNSVTTIGKYFFYNKNGCDGISLPNTISSLPEYGIYLYNGLPPKGGITIPTGVTTICNRAVYKVRGLFIIDIPEGVVTIDKDAFNCSVEAYAITIPSTCSTIGQSAFANSGAEFIYVLATTPPTIQSSTFSFYNKTSIKIYVPSASLNTYKSATNWSTFADYMEGI